MNRFKFILIFIFAILFAFVVFLGGTMPYFLFYIFLLTFLLPLVHNLIILQGLKGSVQIPKESLFTGESINIKYELKNNSILSIPYLEIQSDISRELTGTNSPKVTLVLGKKEFYSHIETVTLKRRGYYQIGEINVIIRDVFGFYSFKKKITNTTSLLVYPETISLSTFKINASQQSGELLVQNSVFQDKSRVNSLREYREGDAIKAIHWKLSAKRDTPIVKDFENRGDTHVTIFMDNDAKFFKEDIDRRLEDKSVDAALSIVNYCLKQNIEVSLQIQNDQGETQILGQQISDFKPFLEALAKFKGNGTLDFKSFFIKRIHMIKKGSTVLIITSNLNRLMGALGIDLKMKNFNPLFIVITDRQNNTGYIDQDIEKRLIQEGILIYIIDYKTSIKEALEVYHG